MRTYDEIAGEFARPVRQAVENAQAELSRTQQDRQAREQTRRGLEQLLQDEQATLRGLDSPQTSLKAEIRDLENRVRDLQRQVAAKRQQLSELAARAEDLNREVSKRRTELGRSQKDLQRDTAEIESKENAVQSAQQRLLEGRISALRLYCEEAFESLQKASGEASARTRFEETRARFEQARTADAEVTRLHEERIELKRLVETSQVQSLRDMLRKRFAEVEQALASRFPGLLEGPPPADDDPGADTFYWYDPHDDLTSVLLPVPPSCWHTFPTASADPRGEFLCRVLWAFVSALAEPVPTIECDHDLLTLELHGDQSRRVSDCLFEVKLPGEQRVTFMPMPLPSELVEALT